jgi:lysophospholipase L1-like esterase
VIRTSVGVAAASALLIVSGCSASSAPPAASASRSVPSTASASTASSAPPSTSSTTAAQLYVSLGDSYAAGVQPNAQGKDRSTTNGFAYQVVTAARAKGYHLSLVNFGCGGATTTSILRSAGCPPKFLGPGAHSYGPKTQAAAAEDYLRAHRGKVGLVTVSIGGNDVTACAAAADPTGCITKALPKVKANMGTLLAGLRQAAGPTTRIVGITYPDVLLGAALSSSAAKRSLASLSVLAFQSFINPQLKASYAAVGASFVDVTQATGAYGSMTASTTLPPYGKIPTPVAKVCELTYYCQYQDIHPRTNGYAIIASLIVGALPQR